MRVLYVEDDEDAREVLVQVLIEHGHRVIAVGTLAQGIAALAAELDVVVVDLSLPDGDGWELAARAKQDSASITVILLTGWGMRVGRDEARARGVDAVLGKPVSTTAILQLLDGLPQRPDVCADDAHGKAAP